MLIPSPRHKPADLALWAELEEADHTHGCRAALWRKVERSYREIMRFASEGPCYASISWGKDSVALAHLIAECAPTIPLVYLRAEPVANPESSAVRDWFLARWPLNYEERVVDYTGIPRGLSPDQVEREKDRLFFGTFPRGRHISGIRADESSGRKIRMRRYGLTSTNACAPLGWWTAADVFGYLSTSELPVHPSYAMLGGGRWERRHIRVDELGGARGDQFGRREWEHEYYGDVLRRLGN